MHPREGLGKKHTGGNWGGVRGSANATIAESECGETNVILDLLHPLGITLLRDETIHPPSK